MPVQLSLWTSLSGEAPARASVSRASALGWTTPAASWPLSVLGWWNEFAPVGSFSKMSPVYCRITADATLEPLSGQWGNAGMGSPTESWTLNMQEFHNGGVASSLSDILETGDLPQQYYLSAMNAGYLDDLTIDEKGQLAGKPNCPGCEIDPATGNYTAWVRLPDGREVKTAIGEVSVAIGDWTDGQGRKWKDVLKHVAPAD